jgi:ABC-type Mn2+/Zn2+ transport system ATPase subunit
VSLLAAPVLYHDFVRSMNTGQNTAAPANCSTARETASYSIHKETKIGLSPISVFVGPNGGGKSAFFDALLNFSMLARGRLSEAFGPYPFSFVATRHRAAKKIARIAA